MKFLKIGKKRIVNLNQIVQIIAPGGEFNEAYVYLSDGREFCMTPEEYEVLDRDFFGTEER